MAVVERSPPTTHRNGNSIIPLSEKGLEYLKSHFTKDLITIVTCKDNHELGEKPTIAIMNYFCLNCNKYQDIWIEGPPNQSVHTLTCKQCDQTIARGKIPDELFKELNK